MIFGPDHFYISEALVPGKGWSNADAIFIREADGRYRLASGADLTEMHKRFPQFFRRTLDAGYCEECGTRLVTGR